MVCEISHLKSSTKCFICHVTTFLTPPYLFCYLLRAKLLKIQSTKTLFFVETLLFNTFSCADE